MKELWDAVEVEFGKKAVRYHRAGIALADENLYDEPNCNLSPQEKARNRKRALLMFRARSFLYQFVFVIVLTVLLTLTIMNCESVNRTCLGKLSNITDNSTDIFDTIDSSSSSEEEGSEGGVLAAVIATMVAFVLCLQMVRLQCKYIPSIFVSHAVLHCFPNSYCSGMKLSPTARRFFLTSGRHEETTYSKRLLAVPSEKISKMS